MKLTNNYGLEIDGAVPQDAGDYICQIATLEPREITHTVEILGKFVTCHLSLSLALSRVRELENVASVRMRIAMTPRRCCCCCFEGSHRLFHLHTN